MMKPILPAVVALLIASIACSSPRVPIASQALSAGAPNQPSTSDAPQWSTFTDQGRGFSISLPDSWKADPPDPDDIVAPFALFSPIDPENAQSYSQAEDWASNHVYLSGFESADRSPTGTAHALSITAAPVPGFLLGPVSEIRTLAQYERLYVQLLKEQPYVVKPVFHQLQDVSGRPFVRVLYQIDIPSTLFGKVSVSQYFSPVLESLYAITIISFAQVADPPEPYVEEIAHTFQQM